MTLGILDSETVALDDSALHLLILDPDRQTGEQTKAWLENHRVQVTWHTDTQLALEQIVRGTPDLLLLEMLLLEGSGLALCQQLRSRSDIPIIMMSSNAEEIDRVLALETGADDCVSKPLALRELLARIRAHVRRARGRVGPSQRAIEVGALRLDPRSLGATLDGRPLHLTTHEFRLLRALAERAGRVLTREQLMDLVDGRTDDAFDRCIDVRVSRLRQKLGDDPREPRMLKTVRGAGYLLAAPGRP